MNKSFSILMMSTALLVSACSGHRSCDFTACSSKQTNGTMLTCTGKTPAYFALNSSVLSADDKENLKRVAKHLKKHTHEKVKIIGFTDSTGPADYNKKLSEQRAQSAANYLISLGIASDRISTKGMGATDFVDSNNTAAGRAKNRRIEIAYLK